MNEGNALFKTVLLAHGKDATFDAAGLYIVLGSLAMFQLNALGDLLEKDGIH